MQNVKLIIKYLKMLNLEAWASGGTARDIYLDKKLSSYDISVKATLTELQDKLQSRIIKIDNIHGRISIIYKEIEFNLYPLRTIRLVNTYPNYENTTYVEEDASSRDFTINALFYNPLNNVWIDLCNGRSDADRKIIRFVGDPLQKILESKIRILRGTILPAMLGDGWELDYRAQEAINSYKLKVMGISPQLIQEEILKVFTRCEAPSAVFNTWRKCNLLREFLPELHHCINIDQSQKAKSLDLYQHIMYALDSVSIKQDNFLIIRLAALLHDIGKPHTEVYTKTGRHFYNHEKVGKNLSKMILSRWGFNKKIINKVANLVEHHLFNVTASSKATSIKKLISRVGADHIHDLLDLRIADRYGTGKPNISMYQVEALRRKINTELSKISPEDFKLDLLDDDIKSILKDKTEKDLLDNAVGQVKKYLENKVLMGRVKNKKTNLTKMIKFVSKINCPLDTPHLFKTWNEHQTGSAELDLNGKLRCGIYCGFNCDKILKKR